MTPPPPPQDLSILAMLLALLTSKQHLNTMFSSFRKLKYENITNILLKIWSPPPKKSYLLNNVCLPNGFCDKLMSCLQMSPNQAIKYESSLDSSKMYLGNVF